MCEYVNIFLNKEHKSFFIMKAVLERHIFINLAFEEAAGYEIGVS